MSRVIVLGLDGLDPRITEDLLGRGALPNLSRLREAGDYRRLATTQPAQTPVAWSSFATGTNPGGHGIFDFLTRNPETYRPEIALHGYEKRGPFLPPGPVSRRRGTAVWDVLSDAGIASTVLRHPCTYPADRVRGRLLAGVGVPDVRGGFGTSTVYASAPDVEEREAERLVPIRPDGAGRVETELIGPLRRGGDVTAPLTLRFDATARRVRIESSGRSGVLEVAEGEWSDWLRVKFKAGALQSFHGALRFHLVSAGEPHLLYASPVNFDPDVPAHPISDPWDYAGELRRRLGGYHTLGMAEDHNGLNNGRLTEAAFLEQCETVRRERLAMMHYELERHDDGLFFCLFDTPDRVQHMFWRYREPEHPVNRLHPPDPALGEALEAEYRACDAAVGEALGYADDDTLVLVLSDHGFGSFQREIHVNQWLHENGFLVLEPGAGPGDGEEGFAGVDWSRTRAYALGLAGIYLNRKGRESEGVVEEDEASEVAASIREGLTGLVDPDRGRTAIRGVRGREALYRGPYVDEAPDLAIATAPGYRVSSDTALGRVGTSLFADNQKRWSGDHVMDPAAVPGILFSSRRLAVDAPRITDLAPTILDALGVPPAATFEGSSMLP